MEKETRRRKKHTPPKPDPALPRIFIKENQEFVLGSGVFIWTTTNGGTTIMNVGVIDTCAFTVTTVTP